MKSVIIPIIVFVLSSICDSREETEHILHGLFDDSNTTNVYYGSLNLDIPQINILSSLNINDVGNPKNGKYSITPCTYDPNSDVVYMAAPNYQNKTILSVINATNGNLINTFRSIPNSIVSLQYDIFQKQLFAHVETDNENVTQIVEIDTSKGNLKQVLGTIHGAKPTDISSYCPICRKYFLMVIQDNHFVYVGVNTTDGGGISWQSAINFDPISIRFDYKTFTLYTAYINRTDTKVNSLIGVLNRTLGGISKVVGTISEDPDLLLTRHSAYDIAQNLYYASNILYFPSSRVVSYVDVNTSEVERIPLRSNMYSSYAWFVKQFVH